jgi:hypothetical protein
MITAQEAKALYDKSGAEVQAFLKNNLEKKITEAATAGKREYIHHIGDQRDVYHPPQPTPLEKDVLDELNKIGYSVAYDLYGSEYVPRGLANDIGIGPVYRNYGMIIRW